jgi:ubiquinone/menaquinone biosynthesis C-methylase UbiE
MLSLPYSLATRIRLILWDHPLFQRAIYLASSSYRKRWNLAAMTKSAAMDAILTGVAGTKEFEAMGVRDAHVLRRFVDRSSIVLDLGCGIGRVEKYLSRYCKVIYGVDVSDRMLTMARENLAGVSNVKFVRNDGHDLSEFHSETFDFVFALLVLQHLDKGDAWTYLREIYRVMKKEGKAYLQFPNRQSTYFYEAQVKNRKYDVARTRWYTQPEVQIALQKIGFRIISEDGDGLHIVEVCGKFEPTKRAAGEPVGLAFLSASFPG